MNATIEYVGDVPWLKMETKSLDYCGVEAADVCRITPTRGLDDDTILMVHLRDSPGSPITTAYPPEDFNALFRLLRRAMEKPDVETVAPSDAEASSAGREVDDG